DRLPPVAERARHLALVAQPVAVEREHVGHLGAARMVRIVRQDPAELVGGGLDVAALLLGLGGGELGVPFGGALLVVVVEEIVGHRFGGGVGLGRHVVDGGELLLQRQRRDLAIGEVVGLFLGLLFSAGQLAFALGRRRRLLAADVAQPRPARLAAHAVRRR